MIKTKLLHNSIKYIHIISAAAFISLIATVAVLSLNAPAAKAVSSHRDCTSNSIVYCGALTSREFVSHANKNKTHDLKNIFADYGLLPSDYGKFISSAKMGKAYKDGRIVVGGRTVATNAKSLGRHKNTYTHKRVIKGKTYYESYSKDVFLSGSIPVMVLFNKKGQMQFAVLTACSNPIVGRLNNPKYACHNLNVKKNNNTTYTVNTKASASNGAKISHVVYNFGDGSKIKRSNPGTKVKHTYKKPGKYKISTTVYVKVPGSQTYVIKATGKCVHKVSVAKPPKPPKTPPPVHKARPVYRCNKLNIAHINNTDNTFAYTVDYTAKNGATLKNVLYTFGDGSAPQSTRYPKIAQKHQYKAAGTFKTIAILTFALPGGGTASVSGRACGGSINLEPVFACSVLAATAINQQKTDFRFSAHHTERRAKLISATFVLDNSTTSTVAPTEAGAIYWDYKFNDTQKHTVLATLLYDVGGTNRTVKCSASVVPNKSPTCPIKGKENLAPDSPECYEPCPLNQSVPVGSPKCTPPVVPENPDLPSTGPGHVVAMFAVLTLFGAGTHYYIKKRNDRLAGLAAATVDSDPAVMQSFIAKNRLNNDEAVLARHEFSHLHPEHSSRTGHHRLIQKAVPGKVRKSSQEEDP